MDTADYNVVVSEHRREIINAIGIAFLRDNAIELRHFSWMPHDGCDLVTACKFGKNSRSGIASRTDQRNPHHPLPPVNYLWSLRRHLWRRLASHAKPRSIRCVCAIAVHSIDDYVQIVNYDI